MDNLLQDRLQSIDSHEGSQLALLLDPDKLSLDEIPTLVQRAQTQGVDYLFFGGSLVMERDLKTYIAKLKEHCQLPVIIFPGSRYQIVDEADGLLFLSLISGRNPRYLVGEHVTAAPLLQKSSLEILPTGYMLIEGGSSTTASYMSESSPIPRDKSQIAVSTAMAGEMLGLRYLYLDAGSGAEYPVPETLIRAVNAQTKVPLIVGGGIRTPEKIRENSRAGADIQVIGTAIEEAPKRLEELVAASRETI